jgi:hypothetical protein
MVCDFLREPYEVDAVLEPGSGKVFRLRWYFCAPGAKALPFTSSVTSPTWATNADPRRDFGIQAEARRKFRPSERPAGALGRCYRGRRDQYLFGQTASDPFARFSSCCPPDAPPPIEVDSGGVVDIPFVAGGDVDGAALIPAVRAGDLDSAYVFDVGRDGGGDWDSADESGYLLVTTVCAPAIAPAMLIAEVNDPNTAHTVQGNFLLQTGIIGSSDWIYGSIFAPSPFSFQFFCALSLGGWALSLQSTTLSYLSAVATGTGPPFRVTGFVFTSTVFGPLPITVTVRQPTTFVRVPAVGGDVDSGVAGDALVWPGVDVDSGAVTVQSWLYGGDVDSAQLSRHDFLFAGDVDSAQLSRHDFLFAGDVDSAQLQDGDSVPAIAGDVDGFGLVSGIGTACTPGFVPRTLYADITNPNALGPVSGTYPLTLGVLGSDVWTYNYPPAPGGWFFQFGCTVPVNMWGFTFEEAPFPPGITFIPTGTSPPFSVGPASVNCPFFGALPLIVTVHE